ncbi:hypothetical protein ACF0H5_022848 [Mactra antiquata]
MESGTSDTTGNVTQEMDVTAGVEDFIATGRTGRRNAMPDILDSQVAGVSTGGLAEGMQKLNCSDGSKGAEGTSSTQSTTSSQGS